ncbi:MAG: bifunctional metallophosphatase/5'-nucleotidase [Clostridiales bacterium]|nr:bifunctional metallophosphatase/5'-nucleotidase [Clostridiales bacterium]
MTCNFRLLFTSDTHGYLYPTDYTDGRDKPMGLFKLAAAFKKDGNTLLLDGGDTLQGSPFTNYMNRHLTSPHPMAQVMNAIGYQYVTLGNHDFNNGVEALEAYLTDLNAVCVCANIRDKAGRLPIRPYAVHTLQNGLRVGITGACTHYVKVWENPDTLAKLEIEEPLPALKRALDAMRGQADMTVCLYHGGYERDLETGRLLTDSAENQAWELCERLKPDVLLTGHQHMAVPEKRINGVLTAQPAYRAVHFVQVDGTENAGRVEASSRLCPPGQTAEPALCRLMRPLEEKVQRWLDTPTGHLDCALEVGDHLEMAVNGSLLANFINTVQLWASGAQVSATALGNDVKGMGCEVTVRNVVAAYVYSNTLLVKDMTGAQLKAYMERSAEYFDLRDGQVVISDAFLKPKVEHYNYDYFSGVDYTFDLSRPQGERVTEMRINGRSVGMDDRVQVCVNNYRASGTGGYSMVREAPVVREIQTDVSELIVDYMEKHPSIRADSHRYLTVVQEKTEAKR